MLNIDGLSQKVITIQTNEKETHALPAILPTNRRLLLPIRQQILNILIALGGEAEEEAAWVINGNVDERMDAVAAKKDRRDAAVTAVLDSDRTAAVAERRRLLDFVMVKKVTQIGGL
eukprot:scaffold47656_cov35-Cyclotella_meneghiniana.AAC.1